MPARQPQADIAQPTDGISPTETLLEGVMEGNTKIQMEQQQELEELFQGKGGVEKGGAGFGGFGGGFGGGIF